MREELAWQAEAAAPQVPEEDALRAQSGLARLFARTMRLYTCGDSASVSRAEADALMRSILYTLGIDAEEGISPHAVSVLAVDDIDRAFADAQRRLDGNVAETLELLKRVCVEMPPFENIALWDTLDSIRSLPVKYDVRFAAHEVP